MRELSMHILDLAQNSIVAGATRLEIEVAADKSADLLEISIADNGKGMTPEFLARVTDPFTTTRTVRRVGLGVPMFFETARMCGGDVAVESELGKGTVVRGTFGLSHIDRVPLGDMSSTLVAIIAPNPDLAVRYVQTVDGEEFVLDTDEIKAELGEVPINDTAVLKWLADYIVSGTRGSLNIE